GAWYGRFKPVYDKTRMLERTVELVKAARMKGVWVIHVTEGYSLDYRELDWTNPGAFHRNQIARKAWKIGSKEAAYYEALQPGANDTDLFLAPRIQVSGFGGTGLNDILRSKGIRNVAVGGFTTDVCVYATVLSAYDSGYRLSELRGQPVIVENKPGANQIIGAEYVAKSAPDGNTLLVSDASSFVINPHLYRNMAYDGLRGFTPITVLVRFPWVVAVHPSVPANTFQELVAYARANPGALSYDSFGLGSSAHISVDYLKTLLGIDIVHVPYKGAGPAVTDLLGGQIHMMMVTPLLVE